MNGIELRYIIYDAITEVLDNTSVIYAMNLRDKFTESIATSLEDEGLLE